MCKLLSFTGSKLCEGPDENTCAGPVAGSLALGAASEGVPAAPMDAPREPHPALRPLARLYAVPTAAAGTKNGGRDGLAELESAARGVGLEAAVLGEWQRVRSARLQGAN